MASGHVNRIYRPNTWLHRPILQNVKKALANSEPSAMRSKADMSQPFPIRDEYFSGLRLRLTLTSR